MISFFSLRCILMCASVFTLPLRRESITRTIRIDSRYDEILKEEASRKGYSVNALMDQILKRYADLHRFYDGQMMLSFLNQTFLKFFEKLDNDEIEEIAVAVGPENLTENLMMRGLSVNTEAIVWFIRQFLGEHSGWFRCDVSTVNQLTRLHLRHHFGHKWSIFLKHYLSSMFSESLGVEPSFAITRNSVNMEFDEGRVSIQRNKNIKMS